MRNAVTVRFFAGARAAAGVREAEVAARDLDELKAVLGETYGEGLARVLKVSSFLVDGVVARDGGTLAAGAVVDVLPPFAGG